MKRAGVFAAVSLSLAVSVAAEEPPKAPNDAPAAREMLSFINVPPTSFTPAARAARTPSSPIFTQETWMLVT